MDQTKDSINCIQQLGIILSISGMEKTDCLSVIRQIQAHLDPKHSELSLSQIITLLYKVIKYRSECYKQNNQLSKDLLQDQISPIQIKQEIPSSEGKSQVKDLIGMIVSNNYHRKQQRFKQKTKQSSLWRMQRDRKNSEIQKEKKEKLQINQIVQIMEQANLCTRMEDFILDHLIKDYSVFLILKEEEEEEQQFQAQFKREKQQRKLLRIQKITEQRRPSQFIFSKSSASKVQVEGGEEGGCFVGHQKKSILRKITVKSTEQKRLLASKNKQQKQTTKPKVIELHFPKLQKK